MNPDDRIRHFLQSLNCDGRYGAVLLAALALLLLPLAGDDLWRSALRYEREGILAGQWWRLASAHIVHVDTRHALVNAAGLALLWALFARSYRPGQWLLALVMVIASTSMGLWWLQPQLQWYVGASGVLHGIFACGCVALLRERPGLGAVAAAMFIAKLAWEHWHGALPLSGDTPVVTAAHVYGALGGALAGLLFARKLYCAPR